MTRWDDPNYTPPLWVAVLFSLSIVLLVVALVALSPRVP